MKVQPPTHTTNFSNQAHPNPVAPQVFVIYDVSSVPVNLHHKLAITLPSKWLEQSVDKLKEAFVNAYNKKFPDNPLDDEVSGWVVCISAISGGAPAAAAARSSRLMALRAAR